MSKNFKINKVRVHTGQNIGIDKDHILRKVIITPTVAQAAIYSFLLFLLLPTIFLQV